MAQQSVFHRDFLIPATAAGIIQATSAVAIDNLTELSLLNSFGLVAIPSLALSFVTYWLWLLRERRIDGSAGPPADRIRSEGLGSVIKVDSDLSDKRLGTALRDVGLTGVTEKLADSPFTPEACMASATHSLMFMGVLGSKWVNDPAVRSAFVEFLKKVERCHGTVKFCLVNPKGDAYRRLHGYRDGKISTESVGRFKELCELFPCLKVKFYDQMPSFRLIFINATTCVVARYKIDTAGYFTSRQGWDAPHVCFSSDAPWSLYEPFETYFNEFWDKAQGIDDVLKEAA